jgi:hypothetical protein
MIDTAVLPLQLSPRFINGASKHKPFSPPASTLLTIVCTKNRQPNFSIIRVLQIIDRRMLPLLKHLRHRFISSALLRLSTTIGNHHPNRTTTKHHRLLLRLVTTAQLLDPTLDPTLRQHQQPLPFQQVSSSCNLQRPPRLSFVLSKPPSISCDTSAARRLFSTRKTSAPISPIASYASPSASKQRLSQVAEATKMAAPVIVCTSTAVTPMRSHQLA